MSGLFSVFAVVATLLLVLAPAGSQPIKKRLSPVILVPGDGGSQLEARLDKPERVHSFCDRKTDGFFNLWLNPSLLLPGVVDCWVDNMKLIYNKTSRKTHNSPGVSIRVPGFGDTSSVEWLDPSGMLPPFVARFILSAYYVDIVNTLTKAGYTRGVNIRGAPYDYRKAPNEMGEYFKGLKEMVEESYAKNNNTRVTFVCHSMGCPITSYFLGVQSQKWKDKFVKTLISLGGAWGGAVKAMKVIASGENLGILIVSQTKLRTEQQTSPSLAYMLPSRQLWMPNDTLAMGKGKNYTVNDYEQFFRDTNFTTGYEMFKDTFPFAEVGLKPPGVEVHCLHGQGLPTTEIIDYRNSKSFPDDYSLILGDGDGTVNLRSLQACNKWEGRQKKTVYHLTIPKVEHMDILSNKDVRSYIEYVVTHW